MKKSRLLRTAAAAVLAMQLLDLVLFLMTINWLTGALALTAALAVIHRWLQKHQPEDPDDDGGDEEDIPEEPPTTSGQAPPQNGRRFF